jgi:hypothetical protein
MSKEHEDRMIETNRDIDAIKDLDKAKSRVLYPTGDQVTLIESIEEYKKAYQYFHYRMTK